MIWDLAGDRRLGRRFDIVPGTAGRDPRSFDCRQPRRCSPDGRVLAVGHSDGTVALIDAAHAAHAPDVPRGPARAGPRAWATMPGGRLLAVGGDDGFLALVDPESGQPSCSACAATASRR